MAFNTETAAASRRKHQLLNMLEKTRPMRKTFKTCTFDLLNMQIKTCHHPKRSADLQDNHTSSLVETGQVKHTENLNQKTFKPNRSIKLTTKNE
jgi:hypothetical protein